MKNRNSLKFSLSGFLILLLTVTIAVSISVFVYASLLDRVDSYWLIVIVMFLVILFLTIIFTIIDMIRRYKMVDNPTRRILKATEQITNGDFNIKLIPNHTYEKYDHYDTIMDNLNVMAEELQKNEILKSDFIANVSHEIKTPLAIIQNYATALMKPNLDKVTHDKYCNILVTTSKKMSDLISNILKLNKLENQNIEEIEEINIGELLRICVLSFENLFDKKQLNLNCDIEDVSLKTSPSSMEIVFNNLLSNAIKFTEPNGSIYVSLFLQGDYVFIKIKDTGCGIDAQSGKHIFDKFYQGDTSHSSEGNGLGLALVKRVIDNLGGQIVVESIVGKGSTFTIILKKHYE